MKNKTFLLTMLVMTTLVLISCGTSRSGYKGLQRKGYGCPANASIQTVKSINC